jgi:hypothetical protein
MIEFKVYRKFLKEEYTIGKFYYKLNNGEWIYLCDTLEDAVRDTKIYGQTAIPYGTYKFVLYYSSTFKKRLPCLLNVPNFTNVMIHSGNTAEDTKGCILLGENKSVGKVINSSIAVNKLLTLLAYNGQPEYNLIIT